MDIITKRRNHFEHWLNVTDENLQVQVCECGNRLKNENMVEVREFSRMTTGKLVGIWITHTIEKSKCLHLKYELMWMSCDCLKDKEKWVDDQIGGLVENKLLVL